MEESDPSAVGARAGLRVDQAVTPVTAPLEGGIQVRDAETDVMDARTALRQEFADGAVIAPGLQEFEIDVAEGK